MQKTINILLFIFFISSYSAQNSGLMATYKRSVKDAPSNGTIYLNKNGTFLTQFFGGCDGTIETKGKWKKNKDTLSFTGIESRIMNDPWKGTGMDRKYLIKKQTLISFSIVNNKIVCDSSELYKKAKNN